MVRQRGFTLIETVVFIIVLGIALGSIVSLFVQSAMGERYPYDQQRAIAIANAYMDEILRKRWDENSPLGGGCVITVGSTYCSDFCSAKTYPDCGTCIPDVATSKCTALSATAIGNDGETRSTFDDIDDYHGLNDLSPVDASGVAIGGYAGYSVGVLVTNTALSGVPSADSKQIVVTVSKDGNSYDLTAFRMNR